MSTDQNDEEVPSLKKDGGGKSQVEGTASAKAPRWNGLGVFLEQEERRGRGFGSGGATALAPFPGG